MTIHKLTAGDGYTYLTRQVAAKDVTHRGRSSLDDYYSQKGESPGVWWGPGLAGLDGIEPGEQVTEDHMLALFGEGRHPDAERIGRDAVAGGASLKDALALTRLGSPFKVYAAKDDFNCVNPWRRSTAVSWPAGIAPSVL